MEQAEKKFEELVAIIREYNEKADFEKLNAAWEFAKVAHGDDKRLSGELNILHPLETAILLASWKMDTATIITGLLHDVVEHGAAKDEDIVSNFGEEIAFLVAGVTKVSKVKLKGSTNEAFVENLRKMFLAISKDLRIVFLRLAERLDNLKTLEHLPRERQLIYAKESLEINGPLAERLGMWQVKSKIDDLAFKFAHPEEYEKVLKLSESSYKHAEKRIKEMKNTLLRELSKQNITVKIVGRKKGLYSLWRKLERSDIDYDVKKVNDFVALRILVDKISDCYTALGVLHKYFKPIPGIALSDFIAVPKPNGYKSIHAKVYGPDHEKVEVQIRTFKMHEEAEYGAAAHWQMSALKSGSKIKSEVLEKGSWSVAGEKLTWVRQLGEWQKEISDSEEFLKAVKFDALSRRIFVFSPKGDVYDLPENATPLDFAYSVHTDLGLYTKGAIVDKKIVPLNYQLQNGQVVEILKYKEKQKPKSDWLNFVVTTVARREIKKRLRKVKDN